MAHGDYNCCMICDSKMEYSGYDASTKESPCSSCIKSMRDEGHVFADQEEVISYLENLDKAQVKKWIEDVGYTSCCYSNPLDEKIKSIIGKDL